MSERLRQLGRSLKRELRVYRLVLADRRTPLLAKGLLGLAVGYALLPVDLIPDFLPIIGHLDDAVIVPALVWGALRLIPREVVEECRQKASEEAGERSNMSGQA